MKGKLVCLIGLAIGGIIGAVFTGKKIMDLNQKQSNVDAKLNELHQQELELLRELENYHRQTDEEIQMTKELLATLEELKGIDPTKIDITIDPE